MDFADLDDWMHTYKPNIKERAGSMKSEGIIKATAIS
jgi:hypothetical protein